MPLSQPLGLFLLPVGAPKTHLASSQWAPVSWKIAPCVQPSPLRPRFPASLPPQLCPLRSSERAVEVRFSLKRFLYYSRLLRHVLLTSCRSLTKVISPSWNFQNCRRCQLSLTVPPVKKGGMPVTYSIDKAQGIIRTQCAGFVTLEQVVEHFRVLGQDPNCPAHLDVLLDLRATSSLPESVQLKVVSDEISRIRTRIQFGACAIVAARDALFGMARMFEVFAAKSFRATRVFRMYADAEAWLVSQRINNLSRRSSPR